MQLLVSVSTADDAAAAVAGGADVVDAKDPAAGPLGPVSLRAFARIRAATRERRPLSAALGDINNEETAERYAARFREGGATFVKIGLADAANVASVTRLSAATVRGARPGGVGQVRVIAVAYADVEPWGLRPRRFVAAAAKGGADGVLLDTARKHGPGLCARMPRPVLLEWIAAARECGVLIALAGRLSADDIGRLSDCRPDIVGVRGAACAGGRMGTVAAAKVMALRAACEALDRPARLSS